MPRKRYEPLEGKTYSLFGESADTKQYYRTIRHAARVLLKQYPNQKELLARIRELGSKKSGSKKKDEFDALIENTLKDSLSVYTRGIKRHLRTLSL